MNYKNTAGYKTCDIFQYDTAYFTSDSIYKNMNVKDLTISIDIYDYTVKYINIFI